MKTPCRICRFSADSLALGLWLTSVAWAADNLALVQRGVWPQIPRGATAAAAVSGNYAYVAEQGAGLLVLDVSKPAQPTKVGSFDAAGSACSGVAVSGNYAYVVDRDSGLLVMDVSDPSQPKQVGAFGTYWYAYGLVLVGNRAFVAAGNRGLQIIDVSDPTQPSRAGDFPISGLAYGVAVAGHYAYVAHGIGMTVIDVADPAHPTQVGTLDTPGHAYAVAVAGNYAYVADDTAGLQVIDVSNPAQPTQVGTYGTLWGARATVVVGNYAYVIESPYRLQIINVSNPAQPTRVGEVETLNAVAVTVAGSHAYVAVGQGGLKVISVSNPTQPNEVGRFEIPGYAYGVAVAGSFLYVADSAAGLQVIDVADPAQPNRTGTLRTPGYPMAVTVAGAHAYIADYDAGLAIVDVSNPAQPKLVGAVDTPGYAYAVAVAGNYAYLADGSLRVIDVSDRARPRLVGSLSTPGGASDVAVSGGYAYVASGWNGLLVADVSKPTQPALVGTFDTPGYAYGVAVAGSYAFVADGETGLQVVEVSNPKQPFWVGSADTAGRAEKVALAGDYAFVADRYDGVRVMDVRDPAQPTAAGGFVTKGYAIGVAAAGPYVYVADSRPGVLILELARPPQIEVPPLSQTVASGTTVTFSVKARGSDPLSYQWLVNGREIPGATSDTWILPMARLDDQGAYTVRVTDANGTATSNPAQLIVLLPEVRLVAFGDGISDGVREGAIHRAAAGEELWIEARLASDEAVQAVSYQWFKDGQPFGEARQDDADWYTRWDAGVTTWWWRNLLEFAAVQPTDAGSYSATVTVEFVPPQAPALYHTGAISIEVLPGPRITAEPPAPLLDQPVTLTVSLPGVPSVSGIHWWGPHDTRSSWTNSTLALPPARFEDAGEYGVAVFHPGVGRPVRAVPYMLRVYPVVATPAIVTQPRDQTGTEGGMAVFTVGAAGGLPLTYQWRKGQADLPGATNFYLVLAPLSAADVGSYRVRASNATGDSVSEAATLLLRVPPGANPAAEFLVAAGRSSLTKHTQTDLGAAVAAFAAAVDAAPTHSTANLFLGVTRVINLAHQSAANAFLDRLQVLATKRDVYDWTAEPLMGGARLLAPPGVEAAEITAFFHNQALPELRAALTNLGRVGPADFTLPLGRAETTLAPVTVDQADVQAVRAGFLMFEYVVRTMKSWNLSVQLTAIQAWLEDPRTTIEAIARDYPDLLSFSDAAQATLAKDALEQAVDAYVQAAGLMCSRSAGVRRLFNVALTDRADEERFRQSLLELKAALRGAVVVSEDAQWRIHLAPLMDGTRSPRSLAPRFVGSGPDAATTPEPAFAGALANVGPPHLLFPAVDRMARLGAKVELAVLAMGEEPLKYQWYRGAQSLAGANAAKLVLPSLNADDVGVYRVVVSNRQGTNDSTARVEIGVEPTIVAAPEPQTGNVGRPLTLRVNAAGSEPLQYQWYREGMPIAGATQSRLVLGDSRLEDAGAYTVRVSNGAGSVWSQPVAVAVRAMPGNFAAPLFAELYDESSFVPGPMRTMHDRQGGVYAYFQLFDMVGGVQYGTPLKLREADLSVDGQFNLGPDLADAEAVAVQPDGKVLIAGGRFDACVVIRVEANGQADPDFHAPALGREVRFITVQPDGRILLAVTDTQRSNPNAVPVPNPTLIRLHADGRLDDSFVAPVLPADLTTMIFAPPVQDEQGGIYLGGRFATVNGVARPNFARLLPNGTLDLNYLGTAGIVGGVKSTQVRGIGFQSDGRAVIVGDFRIPPTAALSSAIGALRFNRDGSHDSSFAAVKVSEMGIRNPGIRPRAMVVLPNDQLLLVANTLVRLNPNGTLDGTFHQPQFGNEAYWLSRADDGRIFVPGVLSVDGSAAGGLAVFEEQGDWIEPLQPGGFGLAHYPISFALLPERRVAIAGAFNRAGTCDQRGVAILEADGRPALRQFDVQGLLDGIPVSALVTPGPSGTFYLMAANDSGDKALARVRADGTWDSTFQPGVAPGSVTGLYGEPDGRLVLVGGGDAQAALDLTLVQRLHPDGRVDRSFVGPSASVLNSLATVHRYPDLTIERIEVGDLQVLARDTAGRLLVAVNSIDGRVRLLRLTATGQEDSAFTIGTVDQAVSPSSDWPEILDPVTGLSQQVEARYYTERIISAAVELPDGRILVSGQFVGYGGTAAPGLVRLNPDGTVDTSLHLASGASLPGNLWALPRLESLAVDPDGNVYLAGLFTEFNGVAALGLARLGPDGFVDPAFTPSVRRIDYGRAGARLQFDGGQLYAAGGFVGGNETFPRALWRLDLGGAPCIRSFPPANLVGSIGGFITLEVVPCGDGPFAYQWQRDRVDLPGADSALLVLGPLGLADAGKYSVQVRGATGSTRSPDTTLRVVPALTAEGIAFSGGGDPRLPLAVIPGVRTVVEASDNLVDWEVIADFTPSVAAVVLTDQSGRGAGRRFYRVQFYVP